MTDEQNRKWWNGFCQAMEVAGMLVASAAVAWKTMGGSVTSIFQHLASIVTSLRDFKAIRGTSATLQEWTIWLAKNNPNVLAKVKVLGAVPDNAKKVLSRIE